MADFIATNGDNEKAQKGETNATKAKYHDSAFLMPTMIYYGITLYK